MGRTPGMGNPLTLQLRCARGPFPLLFTPAHLSPIKAHDPEGSPVQPDSLDPSSDVQEEGCEGMAPGWWEGETCPSECQTVETLTREMAFCFK